MLLRVVLVLGMVVHKLVWEVLARRAPAVMPQSSSPAKRIVKLGKISFLAFLIVQALFLDLLPIMESPEYLRVVGLAAYAIGLAAAIAGRVQLGENWSNLEDREVRPEQNLVTDGVYRYIRHPIYSGDLLLVFGLELALNSWLVLLVIPLAWAVYRQTLAEEVQLAEAIAGYEDYRRQTKMFIPFVI